MIALHLTGVNASKRGGAIRAVKAALVAAGMENNAVTMDQAEKAVRYVMSSGAPRVLIREEGDIVTAEQVIAAARAFEDAVGETQAAEAVTYESDPSGATPLEGLDTEDVRAALDGEPQAVPSRLSAEDAVNARFIEDIPADFTPSREGSLIMSLLLGMCDGNAQGAFVYAKRLAVVSGHPDPFVDAGRAICAAYGFQAVRL